MRILITEVPPLWIAYKGCIHLRRSRIDVRRDEGVLVGRDEGLGAVQATHLVLGVVALQEKKLLRL